MYVYLLVLHNDFEVSVFASKEFYFEDIILLTVHRVMTVFMVSTSESFVFQLFSVYIMLICLSCRSFYSCVGKSGC